MWPFKKAVGDVTVRAQVACSVLTGITEAATPQLLNALVGEEHVDQNQRLLAPLGLEILIFGLHLTDRIVFSKLGASNRSGFMNTLIPAIQEKLQPPLSSQMEQLYNARNSFYGGFSNLYPATKENLKGTLFWEFGKAMGSVYAESNPAAIMEVTIFSMTFMQVLQDAYNKAEVLS